MFLAGVIFGRIDVVVDMFFYKYRNFLDFMMMDNLVSDRGVNSKSFSKTEEIKLARRAGSAVILQPHAMQRTTRMHLFKNRTGNIKIY